MMRFLRWLLLVLVVLGAGLGGLYLTYQQTFYPEPPAANFPKPKDQGEAQAQDLVYARNVLTLDKSWTSATRAKAEAGLAALEPRVRSLTPLQFNFALAEIVALADNGHTSVQSGWRSRTANRVPVRMYPFESGLFVVRADGANVDLLGAKLVRVEATPVETLVARVRSFSGGLPRSRELGTASFAESPEQLYALGYVAKAESARYVFRKADGSEIERELEGVPVGPKRVLAYLSRWLSPQPIKDEPADWRSWITPEHEPLFLQEPDLPYRVKSLPELDAVFIQFRENRDLDNFKIAAFIDSVRYQLEIEMPKHIVLDMRQNGGGDYTTTHDFMRELPKLVTGKIFVLTSPLTFSAGISSVAFVKEAGGARTVIVGEPVGDRLIAYGEGGVMTLPNSEMTIRFATGLHDYKNGCRWFGPCFWVNWIYPVSVATLDPDIKAPLDGAALAAGRDPALEAVAAALK